MTNTNPYNKEEVMKELEELVFPLRKGESHIDNGTYGRHANFMTSISTALTAAEQAGEERGRGEKVYINNRYRIDVSDDPYSLGKIMTLVVGHEKGFALRIEPQDFEKLTAKEAILFVNRLLEEAFRNPHTITSL